MGVIHIMSSQTCKKGFDQKKILLSLIFTNYVNRQIEKLHECIVL